MFVMRQDGKIIAAFAARQDFASEELSDGDPELIKFLAGEEPSPFKPIEPVPFWNAAFDLFELKKTDVLAAIPDEDQRYLAGLAIEGRKTYVRHDPWVADLATLKGYPPEQMDALWVFVQENYR